MSMQMGGCPELSSGLQGNQKLGVSGACVRGHKAVCDKREGKVLLHGNGVSVFIPLENTTSIHLCGSRFGIQ